jgi:hypothetical protein
MASKLEVEVAPWTTSREASRLAKGHDGEPRPPCVDLQKAATNFPASSGCRPQHQPTSPSSRLHTVGEEEGSYHHRFHHKTQPTQPALTKFGGGSYAKSVKSAPPSEESTGNHQIWNNQVLRWPLCQPPWPAEEKGRRGAMRPRSGLFGNKKLELNKIPILSQTPPPLTQATLAIGDGGGGQNGRRRNRSRVGRHGRASHHRSKTGDSNAVICFCQ